MSDEQAPKPPEINALTPEQLRQVVRETVHETMISLGIEASEVAEMQRDFIFLRQLRQTHEQIKSRALIVLVGTIITATLGAVWLGLASIFGGAKP